MNKIASICFTLALLVGCATTDTNKPLPPTVTTQIVKVPVSQCPASFGRLPIPTRPTMAISTLTAADRTDYKKVSQAYMLSISDLQRYATVLENVINTVQTTCDEINTETDDVDAIDGH